MFHDKPIFRDDLPLLFIHIRLCIASAMPASYRNTTTQAAQTTPWAFCIRPFISPALQVICVYMKVKESSFSPCRQKPEPS